MCGGVPMSGRGTEAVGSAPITGDQLAFTWLSPGVSDRLSGRLSSSGVTHTTGSRSGVPRPSMRVYTATQTCVPLVRPVRLVGLVAGSTWFQGPLSPARQST